MMSDEDTLARIEMIKKELGDMAADAFPESNTLVPSSPAPNPRVLTLDGEETTLLAKVTSRMEEEGRDACIVNLGSAT